MKIFLFWSQGLLCLDFSSTLLPPEPFPLILFLFRTFVQSGIYDAFVAKARALAAARTVGDPWTDVQQGPQVDEAQFNKIMTLIESGKKEGAKLEAGGERAYPKVRKGEEGTRKKPLCKGG